MAKQPSAPSGKVLRVERVQGPFITADSQTSANLKNALRSERRSVVIGEQAKSELTIKASEEASAHKPLSADRNK